MPQKHLFLSIDREGANTKKLKCKPVSHRRLLKFGELNPTHALTNRLTARTHSRQGHPCQGKEPSYLLILEPIPKSASLFFFPSTQLFSYSLISEAHVTLSLTACPSTSTPLSALPTSLGTSPSLQPSPKCIYPLQLHFIIPSAVLPVLKLTISLLERACKAYHTMSQDILLAFICTVHTEKHVSLLHLEKTARRSDKM